MGVILENPVGHLIKSADLQPWAAAIGLTIAVGIAYCLAAQLSIALLAKSDGLAMFWIAGGVSAGVLIVFGRNARLPVAAGTMVATVIANLMNDRDILVSTALLYAMWAKPCWPHG